MHTHMSTHNDKANTVKYQYLGNLDEGNVEMLCTIIAPLLKVQSNLKT